MEFKLKRIEAPVNKLIWHDIQQIDFKFKLPLLINRRGEVLLGNCQKQHVLKKQFQDVVVVQMDDYIVPILKDLELAVVEENSVERYHAIEKEMRSYLNSFNQDYELLSLFDDEELRENGLITKENYIRPYTHRFKDLEV